MPETISLANIITVLENFAPTRNAESWDNVGLLVGDPAQQIRKILLTIDLTPAVAQEAINADCDLIIAYHPPIFKPLKNVTAGGIVFDTIRRGAAIYSPHTALDVAPGGTNDMLADVLGLTDRRPLRLAAAKSTHYKLVTFAPSHAIEEIGRAIFEAGGGQIGKYSSCSFRSSGIGTFFGEEGTSPAVGQSGQLEQVEEVRLEVVVAIAKLPQVLSAMRESHPYEEPAFDLLPLATMDGSGQGRIGNLTPAIERSVLLEKIKRELQLDHLLVSGPTEGLVKKAAVCAGSCGDHLDDAIAQNADLYLTGEIRHHDAIKAANAGLTVVCTLHSNSERAVLKRLLARLKEDFPSLPAVVSETDRDPFVIR